MGARQPGVLGLTTEGCEGRVLQTHMQPFPCPDQAGVDSKTSSLLQQQKKM